MNKYIILWVGIFYELNKFFEIIFDCEIVYVCFGICWINIFFVVIDSKWFYDNNVIIICYYMYMYFNNLLGIGNYFIIRNGNKMYIIVF